MPSARRAPFAGRSIGGRSAATAPVRPGWRRRGARAQSAEPGQLARLPASAQSVRHRDHRRQQDQAEADRGEAGRFADRDRAEQAGAVLDTPQQLVHHRDRDRPDHRPKDAAGAADDQHRHRRHGCAEVEGGGIENAGLVHRQRAADPTEDPADAERDQSLPHHADPDRASRHLVLARRLQAIAARGPLERQREDHGRARPEPRRFDAGRGRNADQAAAAPGDAIPVGDDVVDDDQKGEGGDRDRKRGGAHQRQADHHREQAGDRRGDQGREECAEVGVDDEMRQAGRLQQGEGRRQGEERRDVGAGRREAELPERVDAAVADEDLQADDDDQVAEDQGDGALQGGRAVGADQDGDRDQGQRQQQRSGGGGARAKSRAAHTRALPISPPSRPCGLKIRISTGKVNTIASRNGTRPSGR